MGGTCGVLDSGSVPLPEGVDEAGVGVALDDGALEVLTRSARGPVGMFSKPLRLGWAVCEARPSSCWLPLPLPSRLP